MVTLDAILIVLVGLLAPFLPTEVFSRRVIDAGFTPPCPVGWIWVQEYQECVPWLRGGPGGRWRSGPGGRWRGRVCPPGQYWAPGFTECIPYVPPPILYFDDDFTDQVGTSAYRSGPGGRWRSRCPPGQCWEGRYGCVRCNIDWWSGGAGHQGTSGERG